MGNSSSKQPQEEAQPGINAATSEVEPRAEQPPSPPQDDMQHDSDGQQGESYQAAAAPSTVTQDAGDSFKIPSLPSTSTPTSGVTAPDAPLSPNSTSLKALPADIEHILSLGANQDELSKLGLAATDGSGTARATGGEIDQVVKELREKYQQEGTEAVEGTGDLSAVEREMKERGIVRNDANDASMDDKMEQDSEDDSSSSDSDDSSSLDSDSTSRGANDSLVQKKRGARTRRQPAPVDSGDEDGDSDSGVGGSRTAPKTEHEMVEPEPVLPEVMKIDEAAEIAKFGKVESVIETVVVVKADTAGDWRVLDEGTVVCWQDKTVIGAIFETFGSVQQPFYSLRFPANAPPDPAVFTLQKPVFYAPSHAQFVFTRDLRSLKGSDASNVWDEEVGAGEIEFSDDEEEAEYKKRLKQERKSRKESMTPAPGSGRQASSSRAPSAVPTRAPPAGHASLPARPAVSYADTEEPVASTSSAAASSSGARTVAGSSSSIFDLYGPSVSAPSLSSNAAKKSGPRADMGDKPPPGRIGRQMFERDTGRELLEGEQVEFEFSDGDGADDSSDDSDDGRGGGGRRTGQREVSSLPAGGRGRGRGRGGGSDSAAGGRGRGRGRGGAQDRGGGRGSSRGGTGRGGRGGGGGGGGRGGERHVAPLPARASPQSAARAGGGGGSTGLPPRPTFDLPEGGAVGTDERMSIDASQAPAFAPPIRFGEPTSFGGGPPSSSTPGATQSRHNSAASKSPPSQIRTAPLGAVPQAGGGYNPQMPSAAYPSSYPATNPHAYWRAAPPPMHAPQQAYYPVPASGGGGGGGASAGAYSPHQPQAAYPTGGPTPAAAAGAGAGGGGGGGAAGHVNPRFLAQQQQQHQQPGGAPYPGSGPYAGPGAGGYVGGYGGYGYGGGAYGGYGQGQGQGR